MATRKIRQANDPAADLVARGIITPEAAKRIGPLLKEVVATAKVMGKGKGASQRAEPRDRLTLEETTMLVEKVLIEYALRRFSADHEKAAAHLEISPRALLAKMRKYDMLS